MERGSLEPQGREAGGETDMVLWMDGSIDIIEGRGISI